MALLYGRAGRLTALFGGLRPGQFVEAESFMAPYASTFDDFNEMVIQYGYVALFAPAYPVRRPCIAYKDTRGIGISCATSIFKRGRSSGS